MNEADKEFSRGKMLAVLKKTAPEIYKTLEYPETTPTFQILDLLDLALQQCMVNLIAEIEKTRLLRGIRHNNQGNTKEGKGGHAK